MARGGKRKGAGRPKGSKDRRKLRLKDAMARALAEAKANGELSSLAVLQALYRDDRIPPEMRMDAATRALPFEHEKKATNLKVGGSGKDDPVTVEIVRFTDPVRK